MESTNLVIVLSILFAVIGLISTLIYYFARYYVKTEVPSEKDQARKKEPTPGISAPPPPPAPNLSEALTKTRATLWGRIAGLAFQGQIKPEIRDEIEEILYTSDLGPQTAELLLGKVTESLSASERNDLEKLRLSLRDEMGRMFDEASREKNLFETLKTGSKPSVWMVVGVNGVGKTTTIGKLASLAQTEGLKTMIVAGDTFRAAADSQLQVWAERAGCEIFNPENVKDPSAVAYAGLEKAISSGVDLVIVDTAGRLHTQAHLMEELKKMKRVMAKVLPDAPHECLLVIDANAGQNALIQAREFNAAVQLTGIVITKMDGSSKAGVAIGVAHELKVPIAYIGVGESVEDLRPFEARIFIEAII